MWKVILVGLILAPTALLGQNPVEREEEEPPANSEPGSLFRFTFKDRPSLRIGDIVRVDIKSKWHFDFLRYSPAIINPPGTSDAPPEPAPRFQLSRARFGLKGSVTKYFEYEVEREMRATFDDVRERHPWKDVYVNFRPLPLIELKVGKFKLPFGMEENTSPDRLDLIYRSRVTQFLTPARERGAMLHGKILRGDRLGYEAGVFRFDGEHSDLRGIPSAGRTYAVRVSGEPLRYVSILPKTIRHTYLGISGTSGQMIEGANAIHGQTISNFTFFDHLFVKGRRQRLGVEVAWTEGPVSFKGEYMHVSEQRKQQGIRLEDLPDKISRGWYVTGTWTPLGEMKSKGGAPKNPFLTGRGYGALELAARLDVLTYYSNPDPRYGAASRSPRAGNILPNSDRTWTFGATWYINHFMKLQGNGQREWLSDIQRKPVAGIRVFWTGIVRLQLAM
jgi:phosphate-selective porin